jgi:hypothetical protein
VVRGVADEMEERVGDGLHHGLIEEGVFPRQDQAELFPGRTLEVSDEPREAAEERADRHHAQLHGQLRKSAGKPRQSVAEVAQLRRQPARVRRVGNLPTVANQRIEEGSLDHELPDDPRELVEAFEWHADGVGACPEALLARTLRESSPDLLRCARLTSERGLRAGRRGRVRDEPWVDRFHLGHIRVPFVEHRLSDVLPLGCRPKDHVEPGELFVRCHDEVRVEPKHLA